MAAWHGADHIMVIRTAGQSHFDGLIEGTPQGTGGIPITRKQVRAQRKALDFIEDEVGRPINYHSYVSGIAGPEIAVMFAEEGVNGAHQDPQYNVLYRNINMFRSFVDAAESKKIMAWAGMLQIDGAHNANATALVAWKVMPELLVQHAINCAFSLACGMKRELIALSTVPPAAPPAPDLKINLPYAVALRDFFADFKIRAQMNTKYISSSPREATVTHVLNLLISKLTSADIQSTITPDEGRNVPWHMYNIEACDTAKQALLGLDGLKELVEVRKDGYMKEKVRELKERAVLFLEEMLEAGGYFSAVEAGFFIDSGIYPERSGDGISRKITGGIGAGTVYKRDADYLAPVTAHFGYNNVAQYDKKLISNPAALIGGSTFEDRSKIQYIDELDAEDNVEAKTCGKRKISRDDSYQAGGGMARRRHRRRRLHASRRDKGGGSRRPRDWPENEPFRRRGDPSRDPARCRSHKNPNQRSRRIRRRFKRSQNPARAGSIKRRRDPRLRSRASAKGRGGDGRRGRAFRRPARDYRHQARRNRKIRRRLRISRHERPRRKTRGRGDRTRRRRDSDVDDHLP